MSRKGENIYKRKDGRWEGRYKCGFDKNGKTKYKSVYSKTYKDCKEKLNCVKCTQKNENKDIKIFLTVKELLDEWLKNIILKVKKSTVNTYTVIIRNHILPVMAQIPIYKITPTFLNNFVTEKLNNGRLDGKGGLSPKTVQNIAGVLKSSFKYAEKIYGIKNPANFITIPKSNKNEIETLTDSEIKTIKGYCQRNYDYLDRKSVV